MIRRALSPALLYTLAFNLTFFIQELFLVVPKALTQLVLRRGIAFG